MADYTALTVTDFLTQIWSPEVFDILRTSKSLRRTVSSVLQGTGNSIVNVPLLSGLTAGKKTSGNNVTWNSGGDANIAVAIDTQGYCGFILQDFDQFRSSYDIRQKKSTAVMEALEYQWDGDVVTSLGTIVLPSGHTLTVPELDPSTETDAEMAAKLDAAFLRCLSIFEWDGLPESNRYILMNPFIKEMFFKVDRFVSALYVPGQPVVNGQMGSRYGMTWLSARAAGISYSGDTGKTTCTCWGYHSDAVAMASAEEMTYEAQRDLDKIAWKVLAHNMYGLKAGRPAAAIKIPITINGNPFGL